MLVVLLILPVPEKVRSIKHTTGDMLSPRVSQYCVIELNRSLEENEERQREQVCVWGPGFEGTTGFEGVKEERGVNIRSADHNLKNITSSMYSVILSIGQFDTISTENP